MKEEMSELMESSTKLQNLQTIASGDTISFDSNSVKTKLAYFLLAHADKVMDTVAPLEALREILTEKYAEKAQEMIENPELTPGQIACMIQNIESMNMYSTSMLKNILDADKIQTIVAVDASTTNVNNSQLNTLNLPNASSRSKVTKAVAKLQKMLEENGIIEEESESNDE